MPASRENPAGQDRPDGVETSRTVDATLRTRRTTRADAGRADPLLQSVLAIAGLSSLAFAQPLYDLLRRSPEFFAIRDLYMGDLLALVAGLLVGPTLAFSAPGIVARFLRPSWTRWAIAPPVGLLAALIALQAVRDLPTVAAMALALAAGSGCAWAYLRFRGVRSFALLLSAAAVVVPALLVFDQQVRKSAARPGQGIPTELGDTGARAPIVLLVFDEWSLTSILDPEGAIDRDRLPNLARLADRATWYPNATAAANVSELAVPAMLTGRKAEQGRLPTLAEQPVNLFTLLAASHDIHAVEPVTSLCPPELNLLAEPRPSFGQRFSLLISDLSVVWLNLTLPTVWAERLPAVTQTWSAFGHDQAPSRPSPSADKPVQRALFHLREADRAAEFRRFGDSIKPPGQRPGFYFLHSLLPHFPWEYLPSGRSYRVTRTRAHGLAGERWTEDSWPVRHHQKRYLLQVQFVDLLIGELVDRLKSVGLFEQSVIVVTADHGVAFEPGRSRRLLDLDDASGFQPLDLATVPLIIKAPFQSETAIDNASTSLVGLTPRILELAGATTSAVPPNPDVGTPSLVGKYAAHVELPLDREPWRRERLEEQTRLLQGTGDPMAIGTVSRLHGRQVADLPRRSSEVGIRLDSPDLWDHVDTERRSLPAIVQGVLSGPESLVERSVAVAINGVVGATVQPHQTSDGDIRITALLPERHFQPGFNQVEVFLVSEQPGALGLEHVARPPGFLYELAWGQPSGGAALLRRSRSAIEADPVRIPIQRPDKAQIHGYLEGGHRADAALHGWATDLTDPGSTLRIVAFLEGRRFWAGTTISERESVAARFGGEHLYSGFDENPGSVGKRDPETLEIVRREGFVAYAVSRRNIAIRLQFFYAPLEEENGAWVLPVSDGRRLPVLRTGGRFDGAVDRVVKRGERTLIEGWAADLGRGERPRQIVVYRDGEFQFALGANLQRADVAERLENPRLLRTGFRRAVPGAPEPASFTRSHRVFALMLSGAAVELPHVVRAEPPQ